MNDKSNVDAHRQERDPGDRRARAAACRASSPTASWSGPTGRRWCRRRCPKSLLVIGSGAIGIEFASFYRTMGAEVTVVEVLDRILPVEDEEVSAFAKRAFEKQGMKILTGATVDNLKKGANNVTATITAGGKSQEITVDRVISRRRHRRQRREPGPRRHQGEGREDPHRDRPVGLHRRARTSMPSATSPARRGSPTRRCTRACWWSRRSPA